MTLLVSVEMSNVFSLPYTQPSWAQRLKNCELLAERTQLPRDTAQLSTGAPPVLERAQQNGLCMFSVARWSCFYCLFIY